MLNEFCYGRARSAGESRPLFGGARRVCQQPSMLRLDLEAFSRRLYSRDIASTESVCRFFSEIGNQGHERRSAPVCDDGLTNNKGGVVRTEECRKASDVEWLPATGTGNARETGFLAP